MQQRQVVAPKISSPLSKLFETVPDDNNNHNHTYISSSNNDEHPTLTTSTSTARTDSNPESDSATNNAATANTTTTARTDLNIESSSAVINATAATTTTTTPRTDPERSSATNNAATATATATATTAAPATTRKRLSVSLVRRESLANRGSMSDERGSIGLGRCSFAVESETVDEQTCRMSASSVVSLLEGDEDD